MEENVQVIARRVWHIVRVAFFMLRKNISKRKLLLDLKYKYLTMKRPKLAGKPTLHHHHNHHNNHHHPDGAYEFSCSNTPIHAPIYESENDAVNRVLEYMVGGGGGLNDVVVVEAGSSPFPYSPVLPGFGFGRSPMVRQLRVTDSPYTWQNNMEEGEYGRVDEAAEEFIQRFYNQLRQQIKG